MANERKTETIVEKRLAKAGYFKDKNLIVECQQSDSPRINKLLQNASKKGNQKGYPEFIISSKEVSDFLIVIECKADTKKHISKTLDKYADYAVDGVLLYASYLSKEFDVLAIAVSGETARTLRISHYLHLHDASESVELPSKDLLPFDNYHNTILHSETIHSVINICALSSFPLSCMKIGGRYAETSDQRCSNHADCYPTGDRTIRRIPVRSPSSWSIDGILRV